MKNKKLLLIAPVFNPLHTQIIDTLKDLGYDVTFIPDNLQPYSPYPRVTPFKIIKKWLNYIWNRNLIYHQQYRTIYGQSWDIVLCINGWSLEPEILDLIKKNNPQIKTYLYLWDSTRFFDFQRNFDQFDRVYTFDPLDARLYGINYLPLFWVPLKYKATGIEYDISFVGKFHGDRYIFFNKIKTICERLDLNYLIKIVLTKRITFRDKIYKIIQKTELGMIDTKDSMISQNYLSSHQVSEIIGKSKCIIDSEMKDQYGITNRTIISLAQGKKVITTNKHITDDPLFFDNPNIRIIDRINPTLDKDFINSPFIHNNKFTTLFEELRIDNWLKLILSGNEISI